MERNFCPAMHTCFHVITGYLLPFSFVSRWLVVSRDHAALSCQARVVSGAVRRIGRGTFAVGSRTPQCVPVTCWPWSRRIRQVYCRAADTFTLIRLLRCSEVRTRLRRGDGQLTTARCRQQLPAMHPSYGVVNQRNMFTNVVRRELHSRLPTAAAAAE